MSVSPILIAGGLAGTTGEVRPFVSLGAELRRRGHDVVFVGNPYFAPMVAEAGLTFVAVGAAEAQEALIADPDMFGPKPKSIHRILEEHYYSRLEGYYHELQQAAQSCAPGMLIGNDAGAIMVAEKSSIARVRLVLSPARLPSRYDPPHPEVLLPRWLAASGTGVAAWYRLRELRRGGWRLSSSEGPAPDNHPVAELRSKLSFPPLAASTHRALVRLCLWPSWFAPRQRDWPERSPTVGFPLDPVPAEADQGAADGVLPIVATTGSIARGQFGFFSKVVAACARLGRPAVLVSPHADHIPRNLPVGIAHLAHAPFDLLFRRASAVIHHGGIGTTAHALAAGVPQIVAPMRGEQFDVGNRAARLGVAQMLSIEAVTERSLAEVIARMTESSSVRRACERWRGLLVADDGLARAADQIEALLNSSGVRTGFVQVRRLSGRGETGRERERNHRSELA